MSFFIITIVSGFLCSKRREDSVALYLAQAIIYQNRPRTAKSIF